MRHLRKEVKSAACGKPIYIVCSLFVCCSDFRGVFVYFDDRIRKLITPAGTKVVRK